MGLDWQGTAHQLAQAVHETKLDTGQRVSEVCYQVLLPLYAHRNSDGGVLYAHSLQQPSLSSTDDPGCQRADW